MLLYFLLLLRVISWFESQKCMIKPYHTITCMVGCLYQPVSNAISFCNTPHHSNFSVCCSKFHPSTDYPCSSAHFWQWFFSSSLLCYITNLSDICIQVFVTSFETSIYCQSTPTPGLAEQGCRVGGFWVESES